MIRRYTDPMLLGLIMLVALIPSMLLAQGGVTWEQLEGPYGGTVSRMAADSSGNLYAVVDGSLNSSTVYMMEKGTGRWASKGSIDVRIQDLASTPSGMLIAGTEGMGVISSTDHGATWLPAPGFEDGFVWGIALLADGSVAAGGQFGDVSASSNNGKDWTQIAQMPNQVFIQAIAIGADDDLFIGTTDTGLYVVAGGTGAVSRIGLSGGITALRVVAGGDLIAGSLNGTIHRVRKSGGSWSVVASDTLDGRIGSIEEAPGGAIIAAAGSVLYAAASDGFAWRRLDLESSPPTIGKLVIGKEGDLYAATYDGVFHAPRLDGSTIAFAPVNAGLAGEHMMSIAIPGSGVMVVGTMSSAIYRSTDNGASWANMITLPSGEGRSIFNGVNAMAAKGSEIYASAYGGGIYRSTDNGASWRARNGGLPDMLTIDVAIDSAGGIIASLVSNGLYRSTDAGESWSKLQVVGSDYFPSLSVASNGAIVAGAGEAVVRSTNNGATWSTVRQFTKMVTAIFANGVGEIFFGTFALPGESAGIYRIGTNNVVTKLGTTNASVNVLLHDAAGRIYAATDSGAYIVAPGGTTATPINDGLTIRDISSLALSPDGGRLFAGTSSAIFAASLAPSSVDEGDGAGIDLSGSFSPNPARGVTSLSFTLAARQHVTLDLHDATGSLVATLFAADASRGEHHVSWNTEGVPGGAYWWRLRGEGWSRGGMVVITR